MMHPPCSRRKIISKSLAHALPETRVPRDRFSRHRLPDKMTSGASTAVADDTSENDVKAGLFPSIAEKRQQYKNILEKPYGLRFPLLGPTRNETKLFFQLKEEKGVNCEELVRERTVFQPSPCRSPAKTPLPLQRFSRQPSKWHSSNDIVGLPSSLQSIRRYNTTEHVDQAGRNLFNTNRKLTSIPHNGNQVFHVDRHANEKNIFDRNAKENIMLVRTAKEKTLMPSKDGYHRRSNSPTYKRLLKTRKRLEELMTTEVHRIYSLREQYPKLSMDEFYDIFISSPAPESADEDDDSGDCISLVRERPKVYVRIERAQIPVNFNLPQIDEQPVSESNLSENGHDVGAGDFERPVIRPKTCTPTGLEMSPENSTEKKGTEVEPRVTSAKSTADSLTDQEVASLREQLEGIEREKEKSGFPNICRTEKFRPGDADENATSFGERNFHRKNYKKLTLQNYKVSKLPDVNAKKKKKNGKKTKKKSKNGNKSVNKPPQEGIYSKVTDSEDERRTPDMETAVQITDRGDSFIDRHGNQNNAENRDTDSSTADVQNADKVQKLGKPNRLNLNKLFFERSKAKAITRIAQSHGLDAEQANELYLSRDSRLVSSVYIDKINNMAFGSDDSDYEEESP